jgi:hypothetical protein
MYVTMWCNWHYNQAAEHYENLSSFPLLLCSNIWHVSTCTVCNSQYSVQCGSVTSKEHNLQHFWFHFINYHKKNTINIELWKNEFQWRNLTVKIHLLKTKQTWCKSGVVKNVTEQHEVPHHISFWVKQLHSHGWRTRSKVILQEHITNYKNY